MVSLTDSTRQTAAWSILMHAVFQKKQPITIPDWKMFPCNDDVKTPQDHIPVSYCEGAADEPHLFYLPSEYDTSEDLAAMFDALKSLKFSLFCCDYGSLWQKNEHIAIEAVCESTTAALQSVSSWMDEHGRKGPLVVMGRSIGSALAIHTAACMCQRTACLVVESGFDKTIELLQKMGKNTEGLSDPFSNRAKMRTYTKPVLFLHSSRDEYVSITQVEWLVMESRSKTTQFQVVPSPGRNNVFSSTSEFYLQALKDFIYLRMGRRPKLKRHMNASSNGMGI
ncbi:MAG: hypothetical protein ABWK15_06015 [Dissulfuribacterales bacterium]